MEIHTLTVDGDVGEGGFDMPPFAYIRGAEDRPPRLLATSQVVGSSHPPCRMEAGISLAPQQFSASFGPDHFCERSRGLALEDPGRKIRGNWPPGYPGVPRGTPGYPGVPRCTLGTRGAPGYTGVPRGVGVPRVGAGVHHKCPLPPCGRDPHKFAKYMNFRFVST
jgi:hypothetical protein